LHTRPVVVLALSAATGAGLILARSHQRRARNGAAADPIALATDPAPSEVRSSPPATERVGDDEHPELFRIEARTIGSRPTGERIERSAPDLAEPAAVRSVELPAERISGATLVAVAAALALCAVGLAAWGYASRDDTSAPAAAGSVAGDARAISVLSSATARRIPFTHSAGRIALVVDGRGRAVIVLDELGLAPSGRAYQAWVIGAVQGTPRSAALFTGEERVVALSRSVPPGSAVAVTLERAGGGSVPSHAPTLVARRA
jgi:hypothetical protein